MLHWPPASRAKAPWAYVLSYPACFTLPHQASSMAGQFRFSPHIPKEAPSLSFFRVCSARPRLGLGRGRLHIAAADCVGKSACLGDSKPSRTADQKPLSPTVTPATSFTFFSSCKEMQRNASLWKYHTLDIFLLMYKTTLEILLNSKKWFKSSY